MISKKTSSLIVNAIKLHHGTILSKNLVENCIVRSKKYEKLNAITEFKEEDALLKAAEADNLLKDSNKSNNQTKILLGLPISIKDNFCVKGYKTTAGSKVLKDFISPYNATIVNKINEAGGIPCMKTNMDEFGMGSATLNSIHGAVKSPLNDKNGNSMSAGGSSGGAAAVVAAGIIEAAVCSDTGGSVRQPASFCGLVGFKPSYGSLSRHGLLSYASSMDTPGIITNHVMDAALLFDVLKGYDPLDSTSTTSSNSQSFSALRYLVNNTKTSENLSLSDLEAGQNLMQNNNTFGLKDCIIGVPDECWVNELDGTVAAALTTAIKALETIGAIVRPVSIPLLKAALPCYYVLACAEASSNLMKYDGIRYGYRAEKDQDVNDIFVDATSLHQEVAKTRGESFGPEVIRRILTGTFVLSETQMAAYYGTARLLRKQLTKQVDSIMTRNNGDEGVDALLLPTVAKLPFSSNPKDVPDGTTMLLYDQFTVPANLTGQPAINIPIPVLPTDTNGNNSLPTIGIQLLGKIGEDHHLLHTAAALEQRFK